MSDFKGSVDDCASLMTRSVACLIARSDASLMALSCGLTRADQNPIPPLY